ncbi:hypothetical protein [Asaia astilbis]|uniref:hypothetical protein n=1 Tax=Asaia astilbis TaxID=610244 RepID=UPI000470095A|nr:hypothetical protein [Asaia astilbis]
MSQTKSCVMCSRKIQRAPTSCEHNWRNRKFCSDQCSNDFTHSEKKRRDENRESIPASLLERDHTGAIRLVIVPPGRLWASVSRGTKPKRRPIT